MKDFELLEESDEVDYTGDDIWAVQESGLDLLDGPELWITSNTAYVVGGGAEEAHQAADPGVEHSMATKVIQNLRIAMKVYDDEPLLIHLKSCGGCWIQGMAIYNAIRAYPATVTIVNYAQARSMSSLIYLAGDHRVMMPDSQFMFHTGTVTFDGTGRQFRTEYREWEKTMDRMLDIYVKALSEPHGEKSDWSPAALREWVEHQMWDKEEVYFSAQEAVSLGFAHDIFECWSELPAQEDEPVDETAIQVVA